MLQTPWHQSHHIHHLTADAGSKKAISNYYLLYYGKRCSCYKGIVIFNYNA